MTTCTSICTLCTTEFSYEEETIVEFNEPDYEGGFNLHITAYCPTCESYVDVA